MYREVKKELKGDIRAAKKIRLPWWALMSLFVVGLPCVWLFDQFGRLNFFLPTFSSIFVLAFLIDLKWSLRRHAWFWCTVVILAAVHVLVVLFVPWTDKWVPASAIAGIMSVDLIVMLAILVVVERVMVDTIPAAS